MRSCFQKLRKIKEAEAEERRRRNRQREREDKTENIKKGKKEKIRNRASKVCTRNRTH